MRSRIYLIFSIFSAAFLYGQITLVSAVEDKEYKVNQKITLTFVLKIEGNDYVQESPLRLPDFSKFNVIGNASEQNSYVDPEKKIIINQMVYQWVVSPKQPGKIRIGSALVDVNGRTYKTEPIDILVKDSDKKIENAAADAYLSLEVDKKEVYENQPVRAVLRLFSKDIDNFRRVENVRVPAPASFRLQPVSLAKSEIEPVAEKPDWSSQVLAVYLIIPEEPGTGVIPQFSANIKHAENAVKVSSPAVKISVKNFPKTAPPTYKNTVGSNFSVALASDDGDGDSEENSYQIDRPFNLTLKFSGEGTFNESSAPKLKPSEEYIFYPPTVENRSRISANGAAGPILLHYVVIPKKAGEINISTESFSFFNPSTKKFSTVPPAVLAVNVFTPEQFEDSKTAMQKVTGYTNSILEKVNPPVSAAKNVSQTAPSQRPFWPVFLGILALVSAVLFWRKRKKTTTVSESKIPENKNTEAQGHAELDFSALQKHLDQNDYQQFFSDFDALMAAADVRAKNLGYRNATDFVESMHGTRAAENLRSLLSKVQLEKFAPVHSRDFMQEIFNEIKTVFFQLQNNR